jgi:hypothetical protein
MTSDRAVARVDVRHDEFDNSGATTEPRAGAARRKCQPKTLARCSNVRSPELSPMVTNRDRPGECLGGESASVHPRRLFATSQMTSCEEAEKRPITIQSLSIPQLIQIPQLDDCDDELTQMVEEELARRKTGGACQ